MTWRRVAGRALLAIAAGAALVWGGEDLWVRQRLAHHTEGDPLDEVRFYYAARLKSGRVEIYYDQPGTEVCVRAVFPHLGHRPCWYARRSPVRIASADQPIRTAVPLPSRERVG